MLLRTLAASCLVVSSASWSPGDSSAPPVADSVPEAEVARLFAELGKKTNALGNFSATYRARSENGELVITLVYESPDRAKLRWRAPGMDVDSWLLDGQMHMRGDFGKGPVKVDVPLADIAHLGDVFESALRESFPVPEAKDEIGAGPVFALEVEADSAMPDGRALKCFLAWQPERRHVLGWLGAPQQWSENRRDGDRLVRDGAARSSFALSLTSGFFDWIELKSRLSLEELRTDEDLPDDTFVVTPAATGAQDLSDEFRMQQVQMTTAQQRRRVYHRAANAALSSGIDDKGLEAKMLRVFEALHTVVQQRTTAAWSEKSAGRVDAFLAAWREQCEGARNDAAKLVELERAADEFRRGLQEVLVKAADTYVEKLTPPTGIERDPAVLQRISEAEQRAARSALGLHTASPLLTRFDEGRRSVTSNN